MDDKTTAVPPYEANPSPFPQHAPMHTADSYGSAPGQPMMQHDIYQGQTPISPMQTGTTTQYPNQYPNQPLGSPPLEAAQYPQRQVSQPQSVASPGINHPKGDYYSSGQQQPQQQQQIPMQQMQGQPMQHAQSQYQTAIPVQNLTTSAAPVDCPICRHRALTRIESHSGNTTHVWALVTCACFCLGCIPYLINSLKDVEHKCGNCGVALATWHRSGHTDVHAHG